VIFSMAGDDMEPILAGLKRMEEGADDKVALKGLRAGGKILADAMKSRIRRKSGKTADSIKVRKYRSKEGFIGVVVGATGPRKFIGRLLETGYMRKNKRTGSTTHVPAYPWARPAFDSTKGPVREATMGVILLEIQKAGEGS
jgi:hypothetical protein